MNNVDIMVNEHIKIKRMLKVVNKICKNIFETKEVDCADIRKIIDFINNYADRHHHKKEENYLFSKMVKYLGERGQNLITHGMLVEHNFARLYLSRLDKALMDLKTNDDAKMDIIANLISYGNLIDLHIEKEDSVIYPFGYKNLPEEVAKEVDDLVLEVFQSQESILIEAKYSKMIEELEQKYGV